MWTGRSCSRSLLLLLVLLLLAGGNLETPCRTGEVRDFHSAEIILCVCANFAFAQ